MITVDQGSYPVPVAVGANAAGDIIRTPNPIPLFGPNTGDIPELAHLPPEVFAPNTTRPAGYAGKRDAVPNSGDQGG